MVDLGETALTGTRNSRGSTCWRFVVNNRLIHLSAILCLPATLGMDQFVVAGACSDVHPNGNGISLLSARQNYFSLRVGQHVMFTKGKARQ